MFLEYPHMCVYRLFIAPNSNNGYFGISLVSRREYPTMLKLLIVPNFQPECIHVMLVLILGFSLYSSSLTSTVWLIWLESNSHYVPQSGPELLGLKDPLISVASTTDKPLFMSVTVFNTARCSQG